MSEYGVLPGRYPAIVQSYSQARRTCRISIPGLTDGGETLPEAEIEYPIGDKSRAGANATELEITAGDTVWVAFIGGDPRYPIITGYRNPQAGNSSDWRRYHHANIELLADGKIRFAVGGTDQVIDASSVTVTAGSTITLKVGGSTIEVTSGAITLTGNINLNGPISGGGAGGATATFTGAINASKDVTAGGISLQGHTHTGDSGGNTSAPK